jgi:hypothetical protein
VSGRARPRALLAALALAGAAAAPARAAAQLVVHEPEPPPVYVAELRPPGRALAGFDFGIGLFDATCGGCYARGGISLDVFAGAQVAPRVALLAEGWSVNHLLAPGGGASGVATLVLATAGARVWLTPRLWLQGGAGAAALLVTDSGADDDGAHAGPGATLAVGGEPGHRPRGGIDISVRTGVTRLRLEAGRARTVMYDIATVVGYHWN